FEKLPKLYNLSLGSKELNFRTVLDCLLIDKDKSEAFPIEYKNTKKPEKLYRTFRIQVLAESLLVTECLGYSVPFAFIKFEQTGDMVKVPITNNELEEVKQVIREINHLIENEIMPQPTPYIKRCMDCCFWKVCRRA
ncbi:CRISPR-associated protein Cas4, partial [Candidatus Micrarchaeota archaeon]|nr:CRISPR-associated protein Cas4 [Candidatus Micrarchaeota archaeon]